MRILTAAALTALLIAAPAVAQENQPRLSTINVSGEGEAELKPDFAHIYVAVETQADTVEEVVDDNRTSSEEVLERIQGLGISKDDIRTQNFQVFQTPPRLDKVGNEIKVPKFTATHRLRIKTTDLQRVGRIAGEILGSSHMLFQSVSFGLEHQEAGEDEARRAAVKDAYRQAALYAEASGVALGRLIEIREGSAQPYEAQAGFSDSRLRTMKAAGPAEEIPIVPPATLRYTASVNMVWEIAPKP